MRFIPFSFLVVGIVISNLAAAETETKPPVYVGFDGEYGLKDSTSAQAIEKGIRVAFEEINAAGGVLNGRKLELITKDNRSVPARGIENIKQFAQVTDLVAVVGGRFSPVLLEELPIAHELGMILLDAWAAADGIIDHAYHPSYTFRLSLKDSYAMDIMLRHAQSLGAKKVALLLPNTGWGRSNLQAAIRHESLEPEPKIAEPLWYNWGEKDMLAYYYKVLQQEAEALILVANDIEGARLINQLSEIPSSRWLPIICHWGVTGGKMVEKSGEMIHKLNFSMVQTFSFFTAEPQKRAQVMAVVAKLYPEIDHFEKIESPVGFAHAYDLMYILARAIDLAGTTDRAKIRDALEQVKDYQGLSGFYAQPFTADNHDALRIEQVFIARYRKDGVIIPLTTEMTE